MSLPVTSIFNAGTQQKITPRQVKPKKHEEKNARKEKKTTTERTAYTASK
jgi:hypothetical protein